MIILKEISKNRKRSCDLDSSGSVKGEGAGSCKCGDKTLGFIRELSD